MSHHIYQTDGFILGSGNVGEANRRLFILTRDLGLIMAEAQAVRLIESKLRYSLEDYSFSHLSLVRSKNGWRITSASKIFNLYRDIDQPGFIIFVRVFSLLKRLVAGEEKNEELFKIIRAAALFLKERGGAPGDGGGQNLNNFEYILVMRVLKTLGYLPDNELFQPFLQVEIWHQDLLEQMRIVSKKALMAINNSIKESML